MTEEQTPANFNIEAPKILEKLNSTLGLVFSGIIIFVCLPLSAEDFHVAVFMFMSFFAIYLAIVSYRTLKTTMTNNEESNSNQWTCGYMAKSESELAHSLPMAYFIFLTIFLILSSSMMIYGDVQLIEQYGDKIPEWVGGKNIIYSVFSIAFLLLALVTILFMKTPKIWMTIPLLVLSLVSLGLAIILIIINDQPFGRLNFFNAFDYKPFNHVVMESNPVKYWPNFEFSTLLFMKLSPPLPLAIVCLTNTVVIILIQFSSQSMPSDKLKYVIGYLGITLVILGFIFYYLIIALFVYVGDISYRSMQIYISLYLMIPTVILFGMLSGSFIYQATKFKRNLVFISSIIIIGASFYTLFDLEIGIGEEYTSFPKQFHFNSTENQDQFCVYFQNLEGVWNLTKNCIPISQRCDGIVNMNNTEFYRNNWKTYPWTEDKALERYKIYSKLFPDEYQCLNKKIAIEKSCYVVIVLCIFIGLALFSMTVYDSYVFVKSLICINVQTNEDNRD